mgnify:CR=1 FL=1
MKRRRDERVAVTGIGLLTPIGNSVDANWASLMEGKSGVGDITKFDASDLPMRFAGEVKDFDPLKYIDRKMARQYDTVFHYAIAAGDDALEDAGLNDDNLPKDRTAIIVGSGMGGVKTFYDNALILDQRGHRRISPYFVPSIIANMAPGLMAIRYGTRGGNFSVVSACATGAHSIGEAFRMIQHDEADVAIAGGSEAATIPLCIAGFASAKALSLNNDDPQGASRPFDVNRDGFVMGEGAGMLILEREEMARAREARIYAYLQGSGYSSDAFHPTAPSEDGSGAALAIERSIQDAEISPKDLGYINAHATSTPLGDRAEIMAMRKALDGAADDVAISSTKSMTGHLLGAAGAVEAAYTVLALHNGQLPPTINLNKLDPECEMDHVANRPREAKVDFALSNAFGFGGTNTSLIFGKA